MTSAEGCRRVRGMRDLYAAIIANHVAGVEPLSAWAVEWYTERYLDYRDQYLSIMDEYAHAGAAS